MARKTESDPSGQRVNRAATAKKLISRLKTIRRDVLLIFSVIPKNRRIVNERLIVYDYDITPENLEIMNSMIRTIINGKLLQTNDNTIPINWWFKPEIELPVRQGTIEEINEFNYLLALAAGLGITGIGGMKPQRISPESILISPKYLADLRSVYVENFQAIKTLSDGTASQVIQKINSGIKAGLNPAEISKGIKERFDVSQSNADRIARTEVNAAYNSARLRAVKTAGEISGFKPMVRHISALLPKRTRPHHAARHYLVYTPEDQEAWWSEGSNRINCLCTTKTVLIDQEGNYIES